VQILTRTLTKLAKIFCGSLWFLHNDAGTVSKIGLQLLSFTTFSIHYSLIQNMITFKLKAAFHASNGLKF
jgi:hypothetical protein